MSRKSRLIKTRDMWMSPTSAAGQASANDDSFQHCNHHARLKRRPEIIVCAGQWDEISHKRRSVPNQLAQRDQIRQVPTQRDAGAAFINVALSVALSGRVKLDSTTI
jgi:hypothetical protein